MSVERKNFELIPELKNIAKEVSALSEDLGMELEFAIEVLQATASQAPAAPQVDVEGIAREIVNRIYQMPCSTPTPIVESIIRKHLPPAAAPVGQDYSRLTEQIIAICGTFVPGGWAHPGDKCVALIEECLRESSPQGWVRVEDRLPKLEILPSGDSKFVLVKWKRENRDTSLPDIDVSNVFYLNRNAGMATHWHELPAPPSAQPGEDGI